MYQVHGLVRDLVNGIEKYVRPIMINTEVQLIFDRYKAGSIKSDKEKRTLEHSRGATNFP